MAGHDLPDEAAAAQDFETDRRLQMINVLGPPGHAVGRDEIRPNPAQPPGAHSSRRDRNSSALRNALAHVLQLIAVLEPRRAILHTQRSAC